MINKPLPPAKFHLIRPPNENYVYFEDFANNPFRPDAAGYELVNAGWLADFALLVYGDETFVKKHAEQAGLTAAGFAIKFISVDTTQCLVAHNDKFIVIAIRGTEIDNLWGAVCDWAVNLEFQLGPDESGGRVHKGFRELINQAWPVIEAHVREIQADGAPRTLWITGHSLGAGLATLAAERARRVAGFAVSGVYTWGSPRVGDETFKQKYAGVGLADRTFRFVNNTDIVPKIPPGDAYTHVGLLKYIDAAGHLHDVEDESSIEVETDPLSHFTAWKLRLEARLDIIIPSIFADHAPIYYASYVWNNYAKGQNN
jgi:triacylglycerol lipase